jgi:hypothetical protein
MCLHARQDSNHSLIKWMVISRILYLKVTFDLGFVDLGYEANYDEKALEATNGLVFMVTCTDLEVVCCLLPCYISDRFVL